MKHRPSPLRRCGVWLTAGALLCALSGCNDTIDTLLGRNKPEEALPIVENIPQKIGTALSVTADGGLTIHRETRSECTPMGEAGTWTIFVYLCGNTLESEDGIGSDDLWEMKQATTGDNVRFVVETGGCNSWDADYIRSTGLNRFLIQNGSIKCIAENVADTSMGSADTLADFLSWGVRTYPAANMGAVLWNHGSGSISGVCFDELHDEDSLSVTEIGAALQYTAQHMTDRFRFVGFDACLMATAEAANILVPHADYMIASQETEAGSGWDYTQLGTWLHENPDADGTAVGKVICDGLYAACAETDAEAEVTASCVALSEFDAFAEEWNRAAQRMNALLDDTKKSTSLLRGIRRAQSFGGNNNIDGFTNMVDMAALLESSDELDGKAALEKLRACVSYVKNGSEHEDACGLSTYYPLLVDGAAELGIFKEICISPQYLAFVDRIVYGADHDGDLASYENKWFDDGGFWSGDWLDWGSWEDTDTPDVPQAACWRSDCWYTDSTAITYEKEPHFDEDGYFTFSLTEKGMDNTASVYDNVFWEMNEDYSVDLGCDDDVLFNDTNRQVCDNFDGHWFALPDGQPLCITLLDRQQDYNIYVSPILLNGNRTHLRFRQDFSADGTEDSITLLGTWSGLDSEGQAARDSASLNENDTLVPVYTAYYFDEEREETIEGKPYQYHTADQLQKALLTDGYYYYCFVINDVFGLQRYTDFSTLELRDGKVMYDPVIGE